MSCNWKCEIYSFIWFIPSTLAILSKYIFLMWILCDFDRASSLICGNKTPTRCSRGFLLQILLLAQHVSGTTMPINRSSRVLCSGCRLWYFVLWFSSCWSGVELRVMRPVCRMPQHPANRTHNPQLHTRPATWKPQHEIPQATTTV